MAAAPSVQSVVQSAASRALWAARGFFALAIVLIPFRYRLVLASRPVPAIGRDYTDFLLYPADLAMIGVLVLWAISLLLKPRGLTLGSHSIWIPLGGLTLAGLASAATSLDPALSVYHAIRLVALFCFYAFVVNEIPSERWLLIPIGLLLSVQSVVALAQFGLQRSIGLQPVGEMALDPGNAGVSVVSVDGMRLLRAYGLTDHPNILGGCLAFGMILLVAFYLRGRVHWSALAAILIAADALLATFSRSAWLALAVGGATIFVPDLVHRRTATLKRWALLGLTSALLVSPILLRYPRFFGVRLNAGNSFGSLTAERQSIGERVLLLESAASITANNLVLGVGLGAAPMALKLYRPDWPVAFEPPHAAIADAAMELGLPGVAFYLALVLGPVIVYVGRRGWQPLDSPVTPVLALLLAISVVGLFDYYTWMLAPGRLWQWLAWGLWAIVLKPGSSLSSAAAPAIPASSK